MENPDNNKYLLSIIFIVYNKMEIFISLFTVVQ